MTNFGKPGKVLSVGGQPPETRTGRHYDDRAAVLHARRARTADLLAPFANRPEVDLRPLGYYSWMDT